MRPSYRQAEVLDLVAQGMTDREIGNQLGISPKTVGVHLHRLYRRYGIRSRSEAVAMWVEQKREPPR